MDFKMGDRLPAVRIGFVVVVRFFERIVGFLRENTKSTAQVALVIGKRDENNARLILPVEIRFAKIYPFAKCVDRLVQELDSHLFLC